MKYLVCIKKISSKKTENTEQAKLNPADLKAIQIANKLKEIRGGQVIGLSMTSAQDLETFKLGLAMGLDELYILNGKELAGSDTLATAYTLSKAIEEIGPFDVILTGSHTIDAGTGLVPSQLATYLGLNIISNIKDINIKKTQLEAIRKLEDKLEKQKIHLPVLLSIIEDKSSLPRLRRKQIEEADLEKIKIIDSFKLEIEKDQVGQNSKSIVAKSYKEEKQEKSLEIKGSLDQKVEELIKILEKELIGD